MTQCVAVLGEDDQLFARGGNGLGDRVGTAGHGGSGGLRIPSRQREDFAQRLQQLAPLGVLAALAHLRGEGFETEGGPDLPIQFRNRGGRLNVNIFLRFT